MRLLPLIPNEETTTVPTDVKGKRKADDNDTEQAISELPSTQVNAKEEGSSCCRGEGCGDDRGLIAYFFVDH